MIDKINREKNLHRSNLHQIIIFFLLIFFCNANLFASSTTYPPKSIQYKKNQIRLTKENCIYIDSIFQKINKLPIKIDHISVYIIYFSDKINKTINWKRLFYLTTYIKSVTNLPVIIETNKVFIRAGNAPDHLNYGCFDPVIK